MAADSPRNLRDELAALRIDRNAPAAKPPRRGVPRTWLAVGAAVLLLAVGLGVWLALGRARALPLAYATRLTTGGAPGAAAVLSGSGYVVTADKYIAIGVRIPGRIERFFVDEADRVKAGDPPVHVLLTGPGKLTVSVWMMQGDEHRLVARRLLEILGGA